MIKSNDVIGLEKSESIFFTDKSELLRINLQFFADSADGEQETEQNMKEKAERTQGQTAGRTMKYLHR